MRDRVVVVIGATGGIGSAVARQAAAAGAKLVLAARTPDRLAALAGELQSTDVLALSADIRDPAQANATIAQAVARYGRVDALVNAAGAAVMKLAAAIAPPDLDAMLDLNLKGCFYTSQAAAQAMKDSGGGRICNVIGILGKHSMPMATAYCAAKFGAVGMTKCLAEEYKRHGVKVTICLFGGVDTPFWDGAGLKVDRGKMLRPETAAAAILWALSAEPVAVPLEINLQPESHVFL